jgi:DNA polymerase-1
MRSRTLFVDADITAYAAAAASEKSVSFDDTHYMVQGNLSEAKQRVDSDLNGLFAQLEATDMYACLSDSGSNWRKSILPSYKANVYSEVVAYITATYKVKAHTHLEADDVLGLYATGRKVKGEKIIVSCDKDLLTIPGLHFNPKHPEKGVFTVTPEQAVYAHMKQVLTGDRTDNYAGLPGCGPVKADRILGAAKPSASDMEILRSGDHRPAWIGALTRMYWAAIVEAYEDKGLTEADALLQARVARILQNGEYTLATGEVKLWTPPDA